MPLPHPNPHFLTGSLVSTALASGSGVIQGVKILGGYPSFESFIARFMRRVYVSSPTSGILLEFWETTHQKVGTHVGGDSQSPKQLHPDLHWR